MSFSTFYELYRLISEGTCEISSRKQAMQLRKSALSQPTGLGFEKVAFDTRRIDQETEYNPRRGLQNYNRSEAFLSEAMGEKIKCFAKLYHVLQDMNKKFGKEHEWQDSNARVLLSTLNSGLRINQQDGDFSENQPTQGSLYYIEQLLQMRYRLNCDDIEKMGAKDLEKVILSKDEELINKDVDRSLQITKSDVAKYGYDTLMEKLFSVSAPSEGQPVVERSITIVIRDSFPNKLLNKKAV
jgi:hypothetical protein